MKPYKSIYEADERKNATIIRALNSGQVSYNAFTMVYPEDMSVGMYGGEALYSGVIFPATMIMSSYWVVIFLCPS